MMGSKARHFAPLINVSLEELVPQDLFYRHLERTLDLSFVREFVQETYASKGRPSIDPIVFFKLQLVMFFEGVRSERQVMRYAADRLGVLWYLGYDLNEPLPDHSSLTRIRERYGVEIFRGFFEAIVEQCQRAGLVWGQELYFDGTKVQANAPLTLSSLGLLWRLIWRTCSLLRLKSQQREETGTNTRGVHTQRTNAAGSNRSTQTPTHLARAGAIRGAQPTE